MRAGILVLIGAVRERVGIRPGQRVPVIAYGDCIEIVPVRPAQEIRGFLGDLENTFEREGDRFVMAVPGVRYTAKQPG